MGGDGAEGVREPGDGHDEGGVSPAVHGDVTDADQALEVLVVAVDALSPCTPQVKRGVSTEEGTTGRALLGHISI